MNHYQSLRDWENYPQSFIHLQMEYHARTSDGLTREERDEHIRELLKETVPDVTCYPTDGFSIFCGPRTAAFLKITERQDGKWNVFFADTSYSPNVHWIRVGCAGVCVLTVSGLVWLMDSPLFTFACCAVMTWPISDALNAMWKQFRCNNYAHGYLLSELVKSKCITVTRADGISLL